MARRNFNDGQEVTFADLNAVPSALEQMTLDRLLPQMLFLQESKVFGKSFKVSYISATSVSVAAGMGILNDSAQVSPESDNRMLYLAAASTQTLEAAHPSNNRVDIISVKATLADEISGARRFKDASTSTISSVSMVLQKSWTLDLVVTKGAEDGGEAVPSTPTGYMKLCEIAVTASSGLANQAAITDKRLRFGMKGYAAIVGTATYCTHDSLAEAVADSDNIAAGSSILVENNETITTPVTISLANLQIDFKPDVTFTKGGSATSALILNGAGLRINGGRFANFSGGGDAGIVINVTKDYAILFGQRFDTCTQDVDDNSGTATILANVTE